MSAKPQRIRLSRKRGWRMPENATKVDRATPWGNPFVVGQDGSREQCVHLYRMLMAGNLCLTSKATPAQQLLVFNYVLHNREKLRGRDLACWCDFAGACHADVLLEIANAPKCEEVSP